MASQYGILAKYAKLLVEYALYLKPGERLLIDTTSLAEPLLREVYRYALRAGALPYYRMSFEGQERIFYQEAKTQQLQEVDPLYALAVSDFDAYLFIRAPFNTRDGQVQDAAKARLRQAAYRPHRETYRQRTASLELKRCLCEYPTQAMAQNAGLSLEDYQEAVFSACFLFEENPQEHWEAISHKQQAIVDYLNQCENIRYLSTETDISFSTKGRIWINSDGKNNMPSGEVYTAPVEDSVNGYIYFSYPSVYAGEDVEGIRLEVQDGLITSWSAEKGQDLLDRIFAIDDGARRFGEAAIGCNMHIQKPLRNILFDEKIGGSIHMAIGEAYLQNNGKNSSAIHWDMITEMRPNGKIFADGKLIYQAGEFLI